MIIHEQILTSDVHKIFFVELRSIFFYILVRKTYKEPCINYIFKFFFTQKPILLYINRKKSENKLKIILYYVL